MAAVVQGLRIPGPIVRGDLAQRLRVGRRRTEAAAFETRSTSASLMGPTRIEKSLIDNMSAFLVKIVSGGHTGADRAALHWVICAGIPHGGWCSRGRMAKDGIIDPLY